MIDEDWEINGVCWVLGGIRVEEVNDEISWFLDAVLEI